MTSTAHTKVSFKAQMLQAREDAIIQTASRLLADKGFEAMTVDEVAASVGIAKASLYKHFSSKEELACAAMVQAMQKAQAFLADLNQAEDPGSTQCVSLNKLMTTTRWVLQLKLAGEMPTLPSQNSSLRASLMATSTASLPPVVKSTRAAWPVSAAIRHFREEFLAGTHTPADQLFDPVAATVFAGAAAR